MSSVTQGFFQNRRSSETRNRMGWYANAICKWIEGSYWKRLPRDRPVELEIRGRHFLNLRRIWKQSVAVLLKWTIYTILSL